MVGFATGFYASCDGPYAKAFENLSAKVHLVALFGYFVEIVYEVHPQAGAKYGCGRDGSTTASLIENYKHFLHAAKGKHGDKYGTTSLDRFSNIFEHSDDFSFALSVGSSRSETAGSLHNQNVNRIEGWLGPFQDALVVEEDVARKEDAFAVSGYGARGSSNHMPCMMKGCLELIAVFFEDERFFKVK